MNGAKTCHRSYGYYMYGRGASCAGRSGIERDRGQYTRENVGMSSARQVRILSTENPRFPEEGSSTQGQSGPKPRATAVGDGQQVEIPVPHGNRTAGTQKESGSREWSPVQAKYLVSWKNRSL